MTGRFILPLYPIPSSQKDKTCSQNLVAFNEILGPALMRHVITIIFCNGTILESLEGKRLSSTVTERYNRQTPVVRPGRRRRVFQIPRMIDMQYIIR